MTSISIIISAPRGLAHCLPYQQVSDGFDLEDAEIIVVDGSTDAVPAVLPPAVRHVAVPEAKPYALRRAGFRQARCEWIVLVEDHCVFRSGFIQAYRDALLMHPDADLLCGAVTNRSVATLSDNAHFLFSLYEVWPLANAQPKCASIANFAVRRTAIAMDELASDGGIEYIALPRLTKSGRVAPCAHAQVEHEKEGSLLRHCQEQFMNGRGAAAITGRLRQEKGWLRFLTRARHCVTVLLLRPIAVIRSVRGVYPARWQLVLPMLCLGASHASGAVCGWVTGVGSKSREH